MPTTLLSLEYIPRGDINNWDIREDANKDKIDLILGTQHNVTTGAHDNITPETASTGSIGSASKPYANLYVDSVPTPTTSNQPANKGYVDTAINGLDWQDSVISKSISTPPGSPTTGDRYIVGASATGAWAGQDNNITEYNGTSWDFYTVNEGFATWVEDEDVNYTWNLTAWVKFGSTVTHANLIGLNADDHPQYLLADGTRTVGGDLTISHIGQSSIIIDSSDGLGNARLEFEDAGVVRWVLQRNNSSGNFVLQRYDATGTLQDSPINVDDNAGGIDFTHSVRVISAGGASLTLDNSDGTGDDTILFLDGGVSRWVIFREEATGSLKIGRYDAQGSWIDAPIIIDDATGEVTVVADPTTALGVSTKQYTEAQAIAMAIALG